MPSRWNGPGETGTGPSSWNDHGSAVKKPGPLSPVDALGRSIAPGGLPQAPPCPFCEGSETELQSAFGSQLSVATFWCRRCRSPFEFMKWSGTRRPPGESPG